MFVCGNILISIFMAWFPLQSSRSIKFYTEGCLASKIIHTYINIYIYIYS